MKLKGKLSILAGLIICLSCILNDKADDVLVSYDYGHNIGSHFMDQDKRDFFSAPETQCRVPRQSNVINSTRTLTQAQRSNTTNISRHGFTLSKAGKSMNQYTTSLFFVSINRFPSGLAESSHHLIYLGKLII